MKIKILTVFICVLTLLTASAFMSNAPSPTSQYVSVKMAKENGCWTKIFVVYPNEKVQIIRLQGGRTENHLSNTHEVNKVFNQLGEKGYRMVASNGNESQNNYIFEK